MTPHRRPSAGWRRWFATCSVAAWRHRDAEFQSDIDTYVDMLVDEKIAAGLAPEAARRSTLMEIGSVDHIKDNARSVRAGALLAELGSDARYALRMMRRTGPSAPSPS